MTALHEVPADEALAVVVTGKYIGVEFDAPRLDTLLLAMSISRKGRLAQYAGSLHRNYEGKQEVRIYDYVYIHVPMLERMYQNDSRAMENFDTRFVLEHPMDPIVLFSMVILR